MIGFKITCLHCGSEDITITDGADYQCEGDGPGWYDFSGPSLLCNGCGSTQNTWDGTTDILEEDYQVPRQLCDREFLEELLPHPRRHPLFLYL